MNKFVLIHFRTSFFLFACIISLSSASEESADLLAVESIAEPAYKIQAVSGSKYGYPYLVAPTLAPLLQVRSDEEDDDDNLRVVIPQEKSYESRIGATEENIPLKKNHLKKLKVSYEAARRVDEDGAPAEKPVRSYKEPSYRNLDELENDFRPKRRMDTGIQYSQYEYSRSLPPRGPYLSASGEPAHSYYPAVHKTKSYPSSYGHGPTQKYGAGRYEDPLPYYDEDRYEPSPSYPPPRDHYDYKEYSIRSNEPIMGDIRKRLLDYAGASDFYEGEPDYLEEISRNKYKYGNIGNDYYSYGGQGHRDSYRDFPYIESKIRLIKKSRHV